MKGVKRKTKDAELTVGELINQLRLRDPSTLVILSGPKHYEAVTHLEDFVVWVADDEIFPGYTDELTMGLSNSGRPAVYLDSGSKKFNKF